MKNISIMCFFLLSPFYLLAQSDSLQLKNSKKLNTWFRNSYQPVSQKSNFLRVENSSSEKLKLNSFKGDNNFLYVYSYRYHNFGQMPYATGPVSNFNSQPYSSGGLTGSLNIGSYFVASGINYVVDKAIAGRKKPKK